MGVIYFNNSLELADFIVYEKIREEQILDIGLENGEFVLKLNKVN